MALPSVKVLTLNGGLGQSVQTDDGVVGLLLQGVAASGLAVLTPKLISSLTDAEDLGIDAAYDAANSVKMHSELKLFFAESGEGAKVYIMIVPQAIDVETMLDKDEANYAVKLLDFAQGKIRLLGVIRNPDGAYVPDVVANNIDLDIVNALTTGNALAEKYNGQFMPFRVVLPAHAYGGDAGALVDLKTYDKNRCAILLGGVGTGENSVALLLGRLAVIPVQRNAGRVKNGSLNITEVYIGAETFLDVQSDIEAIHDKGFVTFQQYVGKSGYYFTDDPTATASTDDYNTVANGRVIDKAVILAYNVFVNELKDEILINANTGQMQTVRTKYFQSLIENQINTSMTANSEISSVSAFVDPAQNVLSTGEVCVSLEIVPVGYAKTFKIQLGFSNPVNS